MKTVLFACLHNAGRSQMAAAWFNALCDPAKARAISAGTDPGPRVHPEVVEAMREAGLDLAGCTPQRLTDELAQGAAIFVTMGCGESCPVAPGLPRQDWPLEDPKGKAIERVREIRDDVRRRVVTLLRREGWGTTTIRTARAEDRAAVAELLEEAGLPAEGVEEHFGSFVVAEDGAGLVGAAGLELYGSDVLLRSIVVRDGLRGTGLGKALTRSALEAARRHGACTAYLLTTTADAFFAQFGFERTGRQDVPGDVKASIEFRGACPASAVVMRARLG